ncbi:Transglycosylase SLT domain-containing protein [Roseovarius marisflavi]|uniref:Transglycosylase SLT domain-containing protein n=1 Tax=Roseovarius marisflavi TaxID=1054996 RepID=A0A1M7B1E5_9RHOB|nr:lytic transglycosylase domain-containing protein [Roseovarius marisflavi]SHL48764.1 Transglycosylase SLT domain-containing protein [Roseovarius marisflavi]
MKIIKFLGIAAILVWPLSVQAGDPPPFPEFTFKRQKPPAAGVKRRINVQIEPQSEVPPKEAPAKNGDAPVPRTATYSWFWDLVPPELSADAPARLRAAFDQLTNPPSGQRITAPRLQVLQDIALAEGGHILRETIGTRVSPALVLAVIAVESGGRVDAISGAGAQGLMQLMPATASRFGVTDAMLPDQNIKGGVAYLDWLLGEFEGDALMALAGYNAGENAVKTHKGVPPYAETRDYVPKVLAAYEVARGLCKTRPELITDACALNLAMN